MTRRSPAVIALAAVILLPAGASASASPVGTAPHRAMASTEAAWDWPTPRPHRIVEPFRAPATRYSAGHRGIDIAAVEGTAVVAPADGVVHFAGTVVDRPVLSIRHADGVISSMEPVTASVAEGDTVSRGDEVGTVGTGGHCAGCIHLGVRVDGDNVSPLLFLGGIPRAVLLPLGR
ncbi:M23 family metallopeptidase [Agromyces atrinae]|uniref:M23 family metallopeptidase n=1 Tax=Agromyces atrinae TaxID=592376 RepID=UPI001F55FD55|nr:M23 family metallopeptidase [Agromyces atrinae]MCI2958144.1 M23 family metallopeptidase [Agromyces atrinae]